MDSSLSLTAATAGQKRKTQSMKQFMPADWIGHKPVKPKKKRAKQTHFEAVGKVFASIFPDEYGR